MYENMSNDDLITNFGDAGKSAVCFATDRSRAAAQAEYHQHDVQKGTRFFGLFLSAALFGLACSNAGMRASFLLLTVCGMVFALYLRQSASYYAWLLKTADPLDEFLAGLNRHDLCPAAAKWISSVRASGRDVRCFDLEIAAMMNEAYELSRCEPESAVPTAT